VSSVGGRGRTQSHFSATSKELLQPAGVEGHHYVEDIPLLEREEGRIRGERRRLRGKGKDRTVRYVGQKVEGNVEERHEK